MTNTPIFSPHLHETVTENRYSDRVKHYRWTASSPLQTVDFAVRANRAEALIYPPADTLDDRLLNLPETLEAQGWHVSKTAHEGKPALKVTGFSDPEQLVDFLESQQLVTGSLTLSEDAKQEEKTGLFDKGNLSRASGVFYSIGNVLMMYTGYRRGNTSHLGTGVAFMAGDGALALFGKKDDESQFTGFLEDLQKHLKDEGLKIPSAHELELDTLVKKGGLLEKSYDFTHQHINHIKCLAEVIGGGLYFNAGRTNMETNPATGAKELKPNMQRMAAGAAIVAGWGLSLIIPEKKRQPGDKGLVAWAQNNPTIFASIGGLFHNALSTWNAVNDMLKDLAKPKEKRDFNWAFDLATFASMIVANVLYGLSKKTTGGAIKDQRLLDDVYTTAARIVAAQPPELRAKAVEATAEYIGQHPLVTDTKQQVAERLNKQIDALAHNPWDQPRPVATAQAQTAAPKPTTPEIPPAAWVNKMAEKPAANAQLSPG